MQDIRYYVVCIVLFVFSSCETNMKSVEYNKEKYISWVKEHPKNWQKTIGNIETTLHYIPSSYKSLIDYRGQTNELSDSLLESYNNLEYYKMTIGLTNSSADILSYNMRSQQEYSGRLEYFTSYVKDDLFIVSNMDTVYCLDAYLERTYGMNKDITLLIAFPKKREMETHNERTFIYNERLFNLGKIKFLQKTEDLENFPTLKL